ncbi:hypothetical protein ACFLXL_03050, partial [Chloroflexota bacterium]
RKFITSSLDDFNVLGFVNFHPEIAEADRLGKNVFEMAPNAVAEIKEIKSKLEQLLGERGKDGKENHSRNRG